MFFLSFVPPLLVFFVPNKMTWTSIDKHMIKRRFAFTRLHQTILYTYRYILLMWITTMRACMQRTSNDRCDFSEIKEIKRNEKKRTQSKRTWWWLNVGDNDDLTCSFFLFSFYADINENFRRWSLTRARSCTRDNVQVVRQTFAFSYMCIVCPLNQMYATHTNNIKLILFLCSLTLE
jgi:hypothetical protein